MRIITRKEDGEGKIWDPEVGFRPIDFSYSSGLINTGKSFRQLHGLFEAKIRISNNSEVLNAFWMVGDKMLPHVDIVNAQKKLAFGTISENSTFKRTLGRSRFASDYYIFSLEWMADKIVWKINGLEIGTVKNNIPQEEMYININAGLYKDMESGLPSDMEIDWVRCYKRRN
jgi:beta-glucanase (GH16 family)